MEEIKKLGLKEKEKEIIKRLVIETKIIEISYIQDTLYIFLENSKVIVLKNSTKKTYSIFKEMKNNMYRLEKRRQKKERHIVSEWTEQEKEYLRENYFKKSLSDLEITVGKSCYQISLKAIELGLVSNREWEDEEKNFLKENFKLSNYELAQVLKRTIHSIKAKKRILSNNKNKEITI